MKEIKLLAASSISDDEGARFRSNLTQFLQQSRIAQRLAAERFDALQALGGFFVQDECLLPIPNWAAAGAWAPSTPEQILIDIGAALAVLSKPGGSFPLARNAAP